MKIFLTVSCILVCIFFIAAIWRYNKKEDCFELKIVFSFTDDYNTPYYRITFTKNNWRSSEDIIKIEDFTKTFGYISVHNVRYNGCKGETVKFAEQFSSYEDCVNHNKKEDEKYHRLLRLYNDQGIPTELVKEQKPEPEIKEILVKSCK